MSDVLGALTIPFTSFEVPLEVLVLGVITGLTYAVLGIGLVLTYKSTRIINFAHGDVGALTSGVMLVLAIRYRVPYALALAAALALAIVIGGLVEFIVIRRFVSAPRLVVMVATIGVSQVLLAFNAFLPRDDLGSAGFPVPFQASFRIGTLRLLTGEILILAITPLIALGLTLFLRRSKIGLAARASAENLEAAHLAGVPARQVSVAIWMLAALLSTASAVLVAPTRPVAAFQSLGASLMVRALAAAVLGGFSSLPQVFGAGIVLGVVDQLVTWNYPAGGSLELVLLAVILASMLLRRDLGRSARGGEDTTWSLGGSLRALDPRLAAVSLVRRARIAAYTALVAVAIVLPLPLDNARRVLLSSVALFALMGLSAVVLTGFAGQVSLGQFAFVGLGPVVGGRLFQLGYPAWMAILYAVLAGGVAAFLVGVPALRIRGLFLAVVTLSFALATERWLLGQDWLVVAEGGVDSRTLPRPVWFGVDFQSELNYYYLSLFVVVVVAVIVARLRRSGLGRVFMAVRDNEPAAASLSLSPRRARLTAFVISGMIASLGGYFYGGLLVSFRDPELFDPSHSLALVSMVIFGGVTTVTGAVLGALWIRGVPYFFGSTWGILSSGLGIIVILQMLPNGLAQLAFQLRDRAAEWLAAIGRTGDPEASGAAVGIRRNQLPAAEVIVAGDAPTPLVAEKITVKFGGLTAVDNVTVEAHAGEIVGLVGPNGAGKTTLFDVLTGQIQPSSGNVLLEGRDVSALRPEARARLGLGRSFQEARLFPDLPLIDTFRLALERHEPSETVPSLLALPPSLAAERRKRLRADEIVELLGLTPFANRNCGELSTGTRRFAELGCLLAMGCQVLLLDEPTAGIAQREVEAFTPVLKEIRAHLGATMVVIDHDIPMIMGLVDRLYVMSAGRLIAHGDPRILREDPAVIAAYLGTDERVIRRSGAAAARAARS